MIALLQSPLVLLTFTIGIYQLAVLFYNKTGRNSLLHPVWIAALPIAGYLYWLDIDYAIYGDATQVLYFLLGPAIVALAIPLYRQLYRVKELLFPVLITLILGAAFAGVSAVLIAWQLGGNEATLLSVAPKSVTSPIAMAIAEKIGGVAEFGGGCSGCNGGCWRRFL